MVTSDIVEHCWDHLSSQPPPCLYPFCCRLLYPLPFGFSLLISSQGNQTDIVNRRLFHSHAQHNSMTSLLSSRKVKAPPVIPKVLLRLSHSWVTTLLWSRCPIYSASRSPWIYFRHAHTSRTLVLADFSTYTETPLNIRLTGWFPVALGFSSRCKSIHPFPYIQSLSNAFNLLFSISLFNIWFVYSFILLLSHIKLMVHGTG